jgi:hypothetical protein
MAIIRLGGEEAHAEQRQTSREHVVHPQAEANETGRDHGQHH